MVTGSCEQLSSRAAADDDRLDISVVLECTLLMAHASRVEVAAVSGPGAGNDLAEERG